MGTDAGLYGGSRERICRISQWTRTGRYKKEYLLPELVDHLIKNESAEVDVLETKDTWFGVTYQEDKETVMRAFKNLTEAGIYPQGLYQ